MAALGALNVRVGADTSGLDTGLNRAQGRIGKFAAGAGKAVAAMGAMAAAATAAGVAITAKMVHSQMQAIDTMSKLSRQLGTTTASIATMQRAGELAGIQNMDSNLDQLNRRLSQAISGTGEAAKRMDQLGLSAAELQRLPIDERIRMIGRAMNENADATEHAAIANDLFGRSGGQMLEILRDADGALGEAQRQAEAFGLAISDVDALAIERANDAMSSIGAVIQGVWRRITVELAPAISLIAQRFEQAAIDSNGWRDQLGSAMSMVARGVGFVADGIQGLRVGFRLALAGGSMMSAGLLTVAEKITEAYSNMFNAITERLRSMIETANRIPGVNIDTSGLDALDDRMQTSLDYVKAMANDAREAMQESLQAAHEMAMQRMPSEQIAEFMEEAKRLAHEAAEEVIAARAAMAGPSDAVNEAAEMELQTIKDRLAEQVEAVRQAGLSRSEAEQELHAERLETLREALEQEAITEEEYNAIKEREAQRHADAMESINSRMNRAIADDTAEQAARERQARLRNMHQMQAGVSNVLGAMAQENKAFGIAQAIVNTWRGVSESLAAYPMPLAGVMAAQHLAAGMANVANLRSGSKGGSIPSANGAAAMPATGGGSQSQAQGSGASGGGGTMVMNLQGDFYSREAAIKMLQAQQEAIEDGFRVSWA